MNLSLLGTLLLFSGLTLGLAAPLVSRLSLDAAEKLLATVTLSLTGVFLVAWLVYTTGLPSKILWTLPVLALGGVIFSGPGFGAMWRNAEVRELGIGQVLVTLSCLGWLALVGSYSGGGWAADWFEHWERTRFFAERWPQDTLFLGRYPLTARPPLANVIAAAFLQLTRVEFVHYQVISTLLGSLVFLPAALLARRFGGRIAVAVLTVLLLVNPAFVQNATFAWTKLPAALFTLAAVYFFLRSQDGEAPRAAPVIFAATLAAGLLAHYSTGPYALLLGVAWIALGWDRRGDRVWLRSTAIAAGVGFLIIALWLGWSLAVYGTKGTLLSNSSITALGVQTESPLTKIALNLRDTFVPHFLRPLDQTLIAQSSPWGRWRDVFFQSYQLNLFLLFGSTAWLVILRELRRAGRETGARWVRFWGIFIAGAVVVGVAVHGNRDHWGLAHICLQPLLLLGISFLAARWSTLALPWKITVAIGVALDLAAGIVLHFWVQNHPANAVGIYNDSASMNFAAKLQHRVLFLNDVLTPPAALVLALVLALLIIAVARARAAMSRSA
ncbi:MAG TPA: glycosyltransferase family 39 protein [Opitutaceae bacterium]|nr:glycosyltransferase family 39 protein [Opitutaceae bacterium]